MNNEFDEDEDDNDEMNERRSLRIVGVKAILRNLRSSI